MKNASRASSNSSDIIYDDDEIETTVNKNEF